MVTGRHVASFPPSENGVIMAHDMKCRTDVLPKGNSGEKLRDLYSLTAEF